MASISVPLQTPVSKFNNTVPSQKPGLNSASATSFFGSRLTRKPISFPKLTARSTRPDGLNPVTASQTFDVVIVGAGIIGLTIARQFLTGSNLSVAVVDKAASLSDATGAATGAGQGYLWMTHRTPGSDIWELALRSRSLWETFAEGLRESGFDPGQVLGLKKTGSLLIGRTSEESSELKMKVKQLSEGGLRAEYLSERDLLSKEPALVNGVANAAAFLPDDFQMDARSAVAFIEKENRSFKGRYTEFYNNPVTSLLGSSNGGKIVGVRTSQNTLYSKVIILAAGCWSGSLACDLFREWKIDLDVPVKPRKGHLLLVENFTSVQLNHGIMEVGYADHTAFNSSLGPSASGSVEDGQVLSISMTATTDTAGNLVLGSSRQFVGFNTDVDESIIDLIWERNAEFLPKLKELSLSDFRKNRHVRVGLRPYMPDGKPMIGPVPGLSNVFLATGHEGAGILMSLGTAEMVADMVLGNPGKVDNSPFAVKALCSQ